METISKVWWSEDEEKKKPITHFFHRRVVGYLSMKVGKVAATVVGGSMIIMQLAAHKGYIKVGPFSLLFFDLKRDVDTLIWFDGCDT